jgi:hypothetical protein
MISLEINYYKEFYGEPKDFIISIKYRKAITKKYLKY